MNVYCLYTLESVWLKQQMITVVVHLFVKSTPWLMHGEDKKDCVVMYEKYKDERTDKK